MKLNMIVFVYNAYMLYINLYGVYWCTVSLKYGTVLFDFEYPTRNDWSPETLWLLHLGK